MFRTVTLRLRPNKTQISAFEFILKDNCETYNAALQERREAWKLQRKHVSLYDQQAELTELRKDPLFRKIALKIQRDPIYRLDLAFRAFFRRCKAGEAPGFPRFRPYRRYDSFSLRGMKLVISKDSIRIPKIGILRFKTSQPIDGKPQMATIKRIGKKWIIRLCCDVGPAPEKCTVSNPVGIDVGVVALATLSDGSQIDNPRWERKFAARIAAANRALQRKRRKSSNRLRALEILRRAHQSAANARQNYIHHVSKFLISRYDLIVHEELKIRNLAQNSHLSKSIMDAAWGELLYQLKYKAESAGTHVVAVNPRNTSQICSGCGILVRKKLSERQHICECGTALGRDHNAALNILALGKSAAGLCPSKQLALS